MASAVTLFFLWPTGAAAQVILRGLVTDSDSGEALYAAHVVEEGTRRGTITNREGRFELAVQRLPATLHIRFVGYKAWQVTVGPNDDRDLVVALEPAVYAMQEVLVAGDEFATNVLRKAIARKKARREHLRTHESRGYTRVTLENANGIALISEQVFDRYYDKARGIREVIRSRRETGDFYRELGLKPVGVLADFSADVIDIRGLRFLGPMHPDALEAYTVAFAGRRTVDGRIIYDLYLAPKDLVRATFVGRLAILDSVFALVEAAVRPARHVVYPAGTSMWEVTYRQHFAAVDSFWLPQDLQVAGVFRARMEHGPVTMHQVLLLSGYEANAPLPDQPYAREERVAVDSASVFEDDMFLLGRNLVALTPREAEAFDVLARARLTLKQAFPATGRGLRPPPVVVDPPQFRWPLFLGYRPWLWYNRVDGYAIGVEKLLPLSQTLEFEGRLAQTTYDGRRTYAGRLTRNPGGRLSYTVRYGVGSAAQRVSPIYSGAASGLAAQLGQGDYFDYYWRQAFSVGAMFLQPRVRVSLDARYEEHVSMEQWLPRPWLFRRAFRPNPPIDDGRLRSFAFAVAIGDTYKPLRVTPQQHVAVHVEHAIPGFLQGTFSFTRVDVRLDTHLRTFFRHRPKPHGLALRMTVSTHWGDLPAQRHVAIDGALGPFGVLGVLRSLRGRRLAGERLLGVFWEHDFRSWPFEVLGLTPLVDRNMGAALHGGHARAWDSMQTEPQAFYHEIGVSLTNIWGSPLRLDVTHHMGERGVTVGVGLSRLFGGR